MNTDWTELIFTVSAKDAHLAESLLAECTEAGVYVEDYSDMEEMLPLVGAADYVDQELTAKDRKTAAIHLYIPAQDSAKAALEHAASMLENAGIEFKYRTAVLKDADWANDWKKQHTQHRVGKRLILCPTWEACRPEAGDVVLRIDPGGAFGSGEDITTTLCLQMLEKQLCGGERVLDMGCGSGVLGIAALLLGASTAVGIDIEKRVLKEAPQNAELNGVGGRLSVLSGNVLTDGGFCDSAGGDFDLVCGNIVADVQLLMAPVYFSKLRSGGVLVLSGVLNPRAEEVCAAMTGAGLSLLDTMTEGDWSAFAFRK